MYRKHMGRMPLSAPEREVRDEVLHSPPPPEREEADPVRPNLLCATYFATNLLYPIVTLRKVKPPSCPFSLISIPKTPTLLL